MLTKEQALEWLRYKDGKLFWIKNPQNSKAIGKEAGYIRSQDGYKSLMIGGKNYLSHRIVFLIHYGYMPKYIDHIDNNRTNNVIENLRECSNGQNMCNMIKRSDNTTGVKNLYWDKKRQKWRVALNVNCKQKHIGYFDNFEFAELVAIEARNKYHKEFANHGSSS